MAAATVAGFGSTVYTGSKKDPAIAFRSVKGSSKLRSVSATRGTPMASGPVLRASVAGKQEKPYGTTIQSVSTSDASATTKVSDLPIKEIPGGYGLPFFGAFMDKLDFYWFQGTPKFYTSRRDKYNSTVFRVNTVPGPPFYPDPRVVCVVDEKSYLALFDVSKVDKKNVFTGTYMPSVDITGGYRVLSYLDPSEEKHTLFKNFAFQLLKSSGSRVFPTFAAAMAETFTTWDEKLKSKGKVDMVSDLRPYTFKFVVKAFTSTDPYTAGDKSISPTWSALWLLSQIAPIAVVPSLPWYIAPVLAPILELLLHTFPIPAFLVKYPLSKLVTFFSAYGTEMLDYAEKDLKVSRDEALYNLIFLTVFNTFGGVDILFPSILKRLGSTSAEYQAELAAEVRQAIAKNGGLGRNAMADMPMVESAVYEVLRIDPPVPFQYGRAKKDFVLESHEAAFQIKKGEMLAGFMPVATHDPKVFKDPESFLPKRFIGEEGRALIDYVIWANGVESEEPTIANKKCAGKHFVTTVAQLFVATLYSKYEMLGVDPNNTGNITILKPASA